MSRHAFVDESTRGQDYIICAATISPTDLTHSRRDLKSLRKSGQHRIHFATENDRRRRTLLKEISTLQTETFIYLARHRNQTKARAAILATMVPQLRSAGVTRLILEARESQDKRDRADIYRVVGPDPDPPFDYTHQRAASEPLLWIPDAVAWAWGRGGQWTRTVNDLGLVTRFETVTVP